MLRKLFYVVSGCLLYVHVSVIRRSHSHHLFAGLQRANTFVHYPQRIDLNIIKAALDEVIDRHIDF